MGTRVMIMAGGTGGHVFPALAVAAVLRARGAEVIWMGTRKGLEARVVPEAGFDIRWISVSGLRGKGVGTWLLAPFKLLWASAQALGILLSVWPGVVLGMGGFVTGPGGLVSWFLRRPLVLHEQNAVAGWTNARLVRLASRVLSGFPGVFPAVASALHTGSPVRPEIASLSAPEERLAGRRGPLRLLVLGGSLGAVALNRLVPQAVAGLEPALRPEIRHQAGRRDVDKALADYRTLGVVADVVAFIDDMAAVYAWADLVLCRAGALTIAELTAAGIGSILVPYPYAVDDHQTANARFLVNAGAALLAPQDALSAAQLREWLAGFGQDREKLLAMALAARRLARPQAAQDVADLCLQEAGHG